MDKTYCRFCAVPKNPNKQLNLLVDEAVNDEIQSKLSFLNAVYINISPNDTLPKTVCFICYDSLTKAYEFLNRARQSQELLISIFCVNDNTNTLSDDDDKVDCIGTYCDLDDDSNDLKPLELLKQQENEVLMQRQSELSSTPVKIKKELKEEDTSESNSTQCCDQINVQEILDAALNNGPLQIYGQEISATGTKKIKSWNEYPWCCGYCDSEFIDIETLRSHAKSVHMNCGAFKCYDCKAFLDKDNFLSFIQHVKKHRKELRKCCHYCNIRLQKIDKLAKHLKEHVIKPQVPCEYCGEVCSDELALHEHLQTFTKNKPFRKPRRKKGTPITVDDLTCDVCKNVYSNPNSLRDHKKRHSEDWKKNYTCDRCGKMFYKKGTLTSHINAHDQIRPYVCKICNKTFPFPNMLRRHVEMHSGVKPYSCEQCGRCFRLQYQLKAHKIVHTDSMPYVCQFCSKAFRFKQILINHERQHTGAKPYSCKHCNMEFTNWSNYNKHMKRRHNTDTSKKKITPEGVFPVNPITGELIPLNNEADVEEWKSKVMLPCKRGKKKIIKQETSL